jgi:hypothetical protein
LTPVFPREIGSTLQMWLALHEDLRASRRLRLMMDHLAAGLAAYVAASKPQHRTIRARRNRSGTN